MSPSAEPAPSSPTADSAAKTAEITLRHRLEDAGLRLLIGLFGVLPLPWAQRTASGVARLLCAFGQSHAAVARANVGLVWPEKSPAELDEMARLSMTHFFWNVIDTLRSEHWDSQDLASHVSLEGVEHVDRAIARGNGAIMLTPHLGNFELALQRAGLGGVKVLAPVRPVRNPIIYERSKRIRRAQGCEVVDRDRAAPAMLRRLRQNGSIAVLNDQYIGGLRQSLSPFFGLRVATSPGVAILAVRTGARIIPAYVVRDGPDHHGVTFLPALEIPLTGDRARDVQLTMDACNRAYEDVIRRQPEQWMWMHRRFKNSPDLASSPYPAKRGWLRALRRQLRGRRQARAARRAARSTEKVG